MTQVATPATVLGKFDSVVLEDRGLEYRFERRGDEFWVVMPDPVWFNRPAWFAQLFDESWPNTPPLIEARVVMTTGSHHMQHYWVRRPEGGEGPLEPDNGGLVLVPWMWLIQEGRWIPNEDSVLTPPSTNGFDDLVVWNDRCSMCHSVATELRISPDYDRFDTRTVELGIACEACHGPAREHVRFYQSPVRRYLKYLRTPQDQDVADPTIVNPEKLEARRSAEICAQCHSFGQWRDLDRFRGESGVPFHPGDELETHYALLRYSEDPNDPTLLEVLETDPTALEDRFWRDGTGRVAGREYSGFLESPEHMDELTCLSCHSMHAYEDPDTQLNPDVRGNRSCLGCHTDYSDDVSQHTRHRPESSGSECMNCHMPHTTYGFFSAMRSHRIDSPGLQTSTESGRPNACNLCHLDRTLEWTNQYLSEWYSQRHVELDEDERSLAAAVLWVLKGDAVQRTIVGWHMGWDAARVTSGNAWLAPYLAQLLVDPYSAPRQVAYRAIATLPGFRDFDYDFLGSPPERMKKSTEAIGRWRGMGGPDRAGAHLLMDSRAEINVDAWLRILAERDLRPVVIRE